MIDELKDVAVFIFAMAGAVGGIGLVFIGLVKLAIHVL